MYGKAFCYLYGYAVLKKNYANGVTTLSSQLRLPSVCSQATQRNEYFHNTEKAQYTDAA